MTKRHFMIGTTLASQQISTGHELVLKGDGDCLIPISTKKSVKHEPLTMN